jgi:hypothetical protein
VTPPGIKRKTSSDKPSRAERAAQSWHAKQHKAPTDKRCWCCCVLCRGANPHYFDAKRAALIDIFARIRDSVATARLPEPYDRRLPGD